MGGFCDGCDCVILSETAVCQLTKTLDGTMRLLAEGARQLGISLDEAQLRLFQTYYEALIAWNQRVNLTSITDYEEVQTKHFLDSLSAIWALRHAGASPEWADDAWAPRVIDVGSGTGCPGIPLKIAWPSLQLTLLEATRKKAEFLQTLVRQLRFAHVKVIAARAEEVAHQLEHRETYDLAVARAVARLPTLAELTLPLVRVGGMVLAYKGEDPGGELDVAQRAITCMGGQVRQVLPIKIPGLMAARHLVLLDKMSSTPDAYPRRPGLPAKRPL